MEWRLAVAFLILILSGLACERTVIGPQTDTALPVIGDVSVEVAPANVLTAVAIAEGSHASLGAVEFAEDGRQVERTPFVPISGESWRIPVFGLKPSTSYTMRLLARSGTGPTVVGKNIRFQTGELPGDLPAFDVRVSENPTSGYVMIGLIGAPAPKYAVILDRMGRIVWYRPFESAVADFQLQPNNNYTLYGSQQGENQRFYEMDRSGAIVGEYSSATSPETGVHELRLFSGGYALYGVDRRVMDLTSLGGVNNAEVRGMTIELNRPGQPAFHWNTFDHLAIEDATPELDFTLPSVNPWHSNAIEIDFDGHLLVSFRNSDEIIKINSTTGGIIWRLNGKKNQFTFLNDPLSGFWHQHGIRRLPNGNIILFDNGNLHTPPQSRAVEYMLDENAHTATMVWEYRPSPVIFGGATGFAQRLPNGNTLITFGTANRIQEVTPAGVIQWDVELTSPGLLLYRAVKINSLYESCE